MWCFRNDPSYIVFYDSDCGFCSKIIQFLIKRDPMHQLHFAPLRGKTAKRLLKQWRIQHPEMADPALESLIFLEVYPDHMKQQVSVASKACFRIASYLKLPWRLLGTLAILPHWMLIPFDAIYRYIANHRTRYCSMFFLDQKDPLIRDRFLP